GLNDVRVDRSAIDDAAVVLRLNVSLALGVFADRHAAHPIIAQLHLDAGNLLDGLEYRINGTIAETGLTDDGTVLMPQTHRRRWDRRRAGVARHGLQRPQSRAAVNLRLRQCFDISVVNNLFAIRQRLETIEDLL